MATTQRISEAPVTMDQRQRLVERMAQFYGMQNTRTQHREGPHRRTNSFARQWKMQLVTSWAYQIRVFALVPACGSLAQPDVPHVQPQFECYQWPRHWFYSKYSSNSACIHTLPSTLPRRIWSDCLHETSSGKCHWSSLTQDWVRLSLDGFLSYLLSAVCDQLISHYLLDLVADPAARPSCTSPVPNLVSSTWTYFAKRLRAVLCQWRTSYVLKPTIGASCHLDSPPLFPIPTI